MCSIYPIQLTMDFSNHCWYRINHFGCQSDKCRFSHDEAEIDRIRRQRRGECEFGYHCPTKCSKKHKPCRDQEFCKNRYCDYTHLSTKQEVQEIRDRFCKRTRTDEYEDCKNKRYRPSESTSLVDNKIHDIQEKNTRLQNEIVSLNYILVNKEKDMEDMHRWIETMRNDLKFPEHQQVLINNYTNVLHQNIEIKKETDIYASFMTQFREFKKQFTEDIDSNQLKQMLRKLINEFDNKTRIINGLYNLPD